MTILFGNSTSWYTPKRIENKTLMRDFFMAALFTTAKTDKTQMLMIGQMG
jgi:hypothetical protein